MTVLFVVVGRDIAGVARDVFMQPGMVSSRWETRPW